MRLNRVLLLAASFSILIFAMVFTISCSGDEGPRGKEGQSCNAVPTDEGFNIVCGSEVKGVLRNGAQGIPGPAGQLPEGVCRLGTLQANGKYNIICGAQTIGGEDGGIVGNLEGCTTEVAQDNKFEVILTCSGKELYMCGGQAYDPEVYHCEAWYAATVPGTGLATDPDDRPVLPNYEYLVKNGIGVVVLSECGIGLSKTTYDSRKQFCDFSVLGGVVAPYCGPNKERYRTGTPWNEACTGYTALGTGQVTLPCGTPVATAPRIVKATHFCMKEAGNVYTPTPRCGIPNSDGQYRTEEGEVSGRALSATDSYAGDANYSYYAVGNASATPNPLNTTAAQTGGALLLGEYSTMNQELCPTGKKVVKICGKNADGTPKYYEESWQFCASGDRIAPHCSDRVVYDPDIKFCSFVGNSEYNISRWTEIGGWYGTATTAFCALNPNDSRCQPHQSTALTFCGTGKDAVANQYNVSQWMWEYCTEPTKGSFSVIRCAEKQEPADTILVANVTNPDINERSRCQCIPGSKPMSMGYNGCECGKGFKEDYTYATGLLKSTNVFTGALDTISRLNGGRCSPVATRTVASVTSACAATEIKEDGTCCAAGTEAYFNTSTTAGVDNSECKAALVSCPAQWRQNGLTGVSTQIRDGRDGTSCIARSSCVGDKRIVRQHNGIEYCVGGAGGGGSDICDATHPALCLTASACYTAGGGDGSSVGTLVWDALTPGLTTAQRCKSACPTSTPANTAAAATGICACPGATPNFINSVSATCEADPATNKVFTSPSSNVQVFEDAAKGLAGAKADATLNSGAGSATYCSGTVTGKYCDGTTAVCNVDTDTDTACKASP